MMLFVMSQNKTSITPQRWGHNNYARLWEQLASGRQKHTNSGFTIKKTNLNQCINNDNLMILGGNVVFSFNSLF